MNKFPSTAPEIRPDQAQLAKELWEALGCKDPLTRKFIQVAFYAIKVFDFKQRAYGVKNIQRGGADGVRVRLGDKVSRLDTLMPREMMAGNPVEEPIEDTFGDIGNYGLIGLMWRWGWWPKAETPAEKVSP